MKTLILLLLGTAGIQFVRGGQQTPQAGFFVPAATSVELQSRVRKCLSGTRYDAGAIEIFAVDAGQSVPDGGGMLYDPKSMSTQLHLLQECEARNIDAGVFEASTPITDGGQPPTEEGSWLGVTLLVGVGVGSLVLLRGK